MAVSKKGTVSSGAARGRKASSEGSAVGRLTPRSGDGARGVALRLEKRTHLDGARHRVTLRHYGPGLAEVGWSFIPSTAGTKATRGTSKLSLQNQDRAARRARSRLRQLVLTLGADHLLTLTYRANVRDFDDTCADLSAFVRRVRRYKPDWQYVAVAERQQRGAWHWHLAVCGRQDVALLRSAWRHIVGEGNIDVTGPGVAGRAKALALVRYLSKYLSKGFDDDRGLNARRFRASLGIAVPSQSIAVPESDRADVVLLALRELARAGGAVGHVWQSADRSAGWACSWK